MGRSETFRVPRNVRKGMAHPEAHEYSRASWASSASQLLSSAVLSQTSPATRKRVASAQIGQHQRGQGGKC